MRLKCIHERKQETLQKMFKLRFFAAYIHVDITRLESDRIECADKKHESGRHMISARDACSGDI